MRRALTVLLDLAAFAVASLTLPCRARLWAQGS
jgi:hypothetical protein